MDGRDQRIAHEAEALWREMFGRSPEVDADGSTLLDLLVRNCEAKPYERLNRPHLRDPELVFPRAGNHGGRS